MTFRIQLWLIADLLKFEMPELNESDKERIISLREYTSLTYSQIAEIVHCSVNILFLKFVLP